MAPSNQVRADFDNIADLEAGGDGWNHNRHYHDFILKRLPASFGRALDIGCGSGELARTIAARANHVLAVDLSPNMIALALAREPESQNIQYVVQDVVEWEWPTEQFDVIVSVATLHHLPFAQILTRCSNALTAGGTLIVLDLYRVSTFSDFLACAIAFPINGALQLTMRSSRELQRAFDLHGRSDRYMSLSEIRQAATDAGLAHCSVRRHLFFRYSLTWIKQRTSPAPQANPKSSN